MFKSLSFLVASVGAVRRTMQEEGEAVPFIQTTGFIAIIIAASVILLCCIMCQCCSISNRKWVDNKRRELEQFSEIAKTPIGDIEYRKWGNAPYMLMMPGTPGFCHTVVGFDQFGFGVITVSRPGYGRTPITEKMKNADAQADLIMALMDHLGIEKLPVLAASGAGVIGLRLAIQYPDRIQALLLCCATTGQLDHPMIANFERGEGKEANWPIIGRYGSKYAPKFMKNVIMWDIQTANETKPGCVSEKEADARATIKMKDPYVQGVIEGISTFAALGACWPESYDAMFNDMMYYKITIPFDQVKVPVHMIHGECDADINYSQAEQAHKGIEGSILITQALGTHSCQFHPEWNLHIDQQMAFAKKNCGMEYDQAALDTKY